MSLNRRVSCFLTHRRQPVSARVMTSLRGISRLFLPLVLLCLAGAGKAADDDKTAFEFPLSLPWINTEKPLQLAGLKGKVVILDFWTYGCINCIHVLEDLKRLEKKYHPHLVIIGVHTPKFEREKNIQALRNIVVRYRIDHPVVSDVGFQAGRYYGMRAWPTQVLIDPSGEPLGKVIGEGNYEILDSAIGDLIKKFRDDLDSTPLPLALEREKIRQSLLAAPGKIAAAGSTIAISDTLHNRIILADRQGNIVAIAGGPDAGYKDGGSAEARFSSPQGLAFSADKLYIADTGNHLIRALDLDSKEVTTVAGDGSLDQPDSGRHNARKIGLRSPWGLAVRENRLYIAMAGSHQIWQLLIDTGEIENFAGTGHEGIADGPLLSSTFSQPSGLSISGDWLYVADAEDSAVRRIHVAEQRVETLVGTGLFDFGDQDGAFEKAQLQHVLGVAALDQSRILVADTYNNKLKMLDLEKRQVKTLAKNETMNEPGGLVVSGELILIADTNNHRIMRYNLQKDRLEEWHLTPVKQ